MKILLALVFVATLYAQGVRLAPQTGTVGGYVSDTDYTTLQAACRAAGSTRSLLASKKWTALPTQALECNIRALAGGVLQPAAGAKVTLTASFEGDLTRHFDTSLGGTVSLADARITALYPQWFGAQCGGADDTAAVQQTLNVASANRTVVFPCQSTISDTVFVPSSAVGAVLQGSTYPTFNPDTVGDSLVAKSGSSSFQMLKIFAGSVRLQNLGVDCNNVASTGIVWSGAIFGHAEVAQTDNCTGDGMIITPAGGPSATTTSVIPVGAPAGSTVTVTEAALSGVTLGDSHCPALILEYGTPRQEYLEYKSSGNTLTLFHFTPAYTHPVGSTIQCDGNNNGLTLTSPQWFGNGGWGLDIYAGSDENNITVVNPTAFGNKLGGELWSGFVGLHIGGHSEGNSGPAMQLGDPNGGGPNGTNGRQTGFITVEPFQDLENGNPAYNTVKSVCAFGGTIRFWQPSNFTPVTGGCRAIGHVTDVGFGAGIDPSTDGVFAIKTAHGMITIQPGSNVGDGLYFYDASGKLVDFLNTRDLHTGGFAAGSDVTTYATSQFAVHGSSPTDARQLLLGYRTDSLRGFLQSNNEFTAYTPLDLNPLGGNVTIGHSAGGITRTYPNNAAAIAGGLVAGDIYAIAGTDPRQLAIVF